MRCLKDILRRQQDYQAIKEAVTILKKKFPVIKVKLFGSKARGVDDPESDIDLLVLTSKHILWQERNSMTDALYDVQVKYNVVLSLLVVSVDEWNNGLLTALPIHDEIEEEGIAA